jgi:hypothetical protein
MRRTLMLTLALLISARWLQAQEGVPGVNVGAAATYPPTIEGCLTNSSLRYMVIGRDGMVYNLTGSTARLGRYVGHEVQITGRPTVRSFSTTEKGIASSVEEISALEVRDVKELSQTCHAASP